MNKWQKTPLNEQETIIQISRDVEYAFIWTSDTTMCTKLDKKYPRVESTSRDGLLTSVSYKVPKKDVKVTPARTYTEEQRKRMAERIKANGFGKKSKC